MEARLLADHATSRGSNRVDRALNRSRTRWPPQQGRLHAQEVGEIRWALLSSSEASPRLLPAAAGVQAVQPGRKREFPGGGQWDSEKRVP